MKKTTKRSVQTEQMVLLALLSAIVAIERAIYNCSSATRRREAECRGAILVVDILGERECIEEVATEEMGANIRRTLVGEI
mgnify:CR=1 FL=1